MGAAKGRGSGSLFCTLLILNPGVFLASPTPIVLEIHVHKHTDSLPPHTYIHTHTLGRMTAQLGCVRGARAGVVWSVCMRVCGRICGEVWAVCAYACVCMCVCVCVCGLGVWSLARAWGEPADGWDEKRAAVFTLLWGLCMDMGTLPRPLSKTPAYTHNTSHRNEWDTCQIFMSHTTINTLN